MKVIVANSRTEEMAGDLKKLNDDEEERLIGAWGAQRMLWFAEDGDIVILPWLPPAVYLKYVTTVTGTNPSTLTLLVPPPGELGEDLLTPDRITDGRLIAEFVAALNGHEPERILSCYDDQTIVTFAEAAGIPSALHGYSYAAQGGVGLVNSKAAFRAIASGTGVPVAPGAVTAHKEHAAQTIAEIFASGHPVMIKQEFNSGGFGNRILSPHDGVKAAGALRVEVIPASAVRQYIDDTWEWMTDGRRGRVIIERFFTDCVTVYAESDVRDARIVLSGIGQILMEPVAAGEIVPPQDITQDAMNQVATGGQQLCEIFRTLGYRGYISADAIVTPDGEVFFTETNGRVTGSTHLHLVLKKRVLARGHHGPRVLLEREGWRAPTYESAVDALTTTGLGYDDATGVGVVITANYVPIGEGVMYCAIGRNYEEALSLEAALHAVKFEQAHV